MTLDLHHTDVELIVSISCGTHMATNAPYVQNNVYLQHSGHGIAPHYGIRTLDISRSIASIALSIACNTSSDKLYKCINACLIFATQNHGDSLPHDAGCESNATLRPKLSRTFTHQCLHAHQCKRVAESSNKSSLTPVPFLHAILYIEVKYWFLELNNHRP